jgi:hypothetical protein
MQNSLSIDQVYEIYKNNNDAKFMIKIKKKVKKVLE